MKKLLLIASLLVSISGANVFAQAPSSGDAPAAVAGKQDGASHKDTEQAANAECDVNATVQQCCSAAKCQGKVLSNRDAHNCKDKSKGKSWHAARKGGSPLRASGCNRLVTGPIRPAAAGPVVNSRSCRTTIQLPAHQGSSMIRQGSWSLRS